jgi:predicted transcriptional regulator
MSETPSRTELLTALRRVGREHSDATVLFHSALAGELGLHPTDYKALGVVQRLGPMSAGELGRRTGLAAASVTNLIDRLEARGFLRRESDPAEVSDNAFFASWQQSTARMWERYTDTELAVILDFLGDTAERLRSRTEAIATSGVRAASKQGRPHAGRAD